MNIFSSIQLVFYYSFRCQLYLLLIIIHILSIPHYSHYFSNVFIITNILELWILTKYYLNIYEFSFHKLIYIIELINYYFVLRNLIAYIYLIFGIYPFFYIVLLFLVYFGYISFIILKNYINTFYGIR